ncbi:lipoprotein [Rhodococcus gordoniae]|uniref:Lipoprotein n=1 Tax=Rhodococcus gordoniae TaxID=223392 RepID=A0A379LXQ5_9NOCA|nr:MULTISPECIES: hypothetical protein [Rhodococcus]SUE13925.1 lipoprotein [Rhodococcus gordoniae]
MRQKRIHKSAFVFFTAGVALTACSSEDSTVDIRNAADIGSPTSAAAESPYLVKITQNYPSCEAIGAPLERYIDGLTPAPGGIVSTRRVNCVWEAEAGEPPSGLRSVAVVVEPETVTPATAAKTGLVVLPDTAIEAAGGFAHSMPINLAGTAFTATGVELPQASVSITVGGRDAASVLDPAGGVAVAKQLLGL